MANPDIKTGDWVDVHYRAYFGNGQTWERRFTAMFMGQEGPIVFFNFRPIAGTQKIEVKDIISIKHAQIHKATYSINVRRIPKEA